MLVLLGLLPAATYVLTGYAVRPAGQVFAPLRLALVRAAVLLGALGAVLVETLGAAHELTHPALVLTWAIATLLALLGAGARYRLDRRRAGDRHRIDPSRAGDRPAGRRLPDIRGRVRAAWAGAGRPERIMVVGLAVLLLGELLIAAISPPNNYDSQTYHLSRIEHWVLQRDVGFFATRIHRQLTMAPGAEYLLLHLRLLTGGNALYNLLQYSAGIGCALVASRIAGQLGGSPRAQVLAAFVFGTAPMVALESTSTQTDLVVAAWTACVATLVLDGLHRRARAVDVAVLGLATGLTGLTKENGLLAVGPLLVIWGVAQLRQDALRARRAAHETEPARKTGPAPEPGPARETGPKGSFAFVWLSGPLRTAGATVAILALAVAVAGPFLVRIDDAYGNLLGPDYLRDSISMQRHDPQSIFINALRVGHTALDTPIAPLNDAVARGIKGLSRDIGVDPEDPRTTFARTAFPITSWMPDEDKASFPVQGILVLLGAGFLLVRPARRVPAGRVWPVRVYTAAWWLSVILYVSTIKWQPWGNRLIMYLLALGAPLAGLWLDSLFRRRATADEPVPHELGGQGPGRQGPGGQGPGRQGLGRRVAAGVAVAALVVGGCAGGLAVGYGWPRRLVGTGSVFTDGDLKALFQRRPLWRADYEWAAAAVRASGAKRVGLVQNQDTWEYPWWLLLPGRDIEAEQSLTPGMPPVKPNQVDAMVCTETPGVCAQYVPHGWKLHMRDGIIGYALPPGK